MAYTVEYSFSVFIEAISLGGDHTSTSNSRKDNVVPLLGKSFNILDSFTFGSVPKKTAVVGHADLDVMVVLHFGDHIEGKLPSQVLKDVRECLAEYRTGVRRNGQAVTLGYKTWPDVDIVPVSRTKNGDGTVSHYNVPDANSESWIVSKPRLHAGQIRERASECGPEFRRLIRMIKWWNHQHSSYLQSYHIEVLALKIVSGSISSYSWELYNFFNEAHKLVQTLLWHEGGWADEYLSYNQRSEALTRLASARDKALTAWFSTHGENDKHEEAVRLYRQIFGERFPAYGN